VISRPPGEERAQLVSGLAAVVNKLGGLTMSWRFDRKVLTPRPPRPRNARCATPPPAIRRPHRDHAGSIAGAPLSAALLSRWRQPTRAKGEGADSCRRPHST